MNICIPVDNDVDMLDVTGRYEMLAWGGPYALRFPERILQSSGRYERWAHRSLA
jgi:hypothetical protein